MIDNRVEARASAIRHVARTALFTTSLLTIGLVLAGCSGHSEFPAGSKLRVYAADVTGGAKMCEAPNVSPVPGSSPEVAIKVTNDGGWCGILLHREGPKPFDAGLLTSRPAHGSVTIHEVGDHTRIDYTPDRGFAGKDAFEVKLIPGDAVVHVAVTVAGFGT